MINIILKIVKQVNRPEQLGASLFSIMFAPLNKQILYNNALNALILKRERGEGKKKKMGGGRGAEEKNNSKVTAQYAPGMCTKLNPCNMFLHRTA